MRKTKLRIEQEFDFDLWGIISNAKGYRLAWEINQVFGINLQKASDIIIDFVNQKNLIIGNYKYEKGNSKLILIRNKGLLNNSIPSYIIPELQKFDFLFWIKTYDAFDLDKLMSVLRSSSIIQYLIGIELKKLKSRENLLF